MLRIHTINPVLPAWMVENYRHHTLHRTIRRTYANWRQRFPRWANAGFDEYFLLHDALPLLRSMLNGQQCADPSQLAYKWVMAYGIPAERMQRAVAEVTPVAADFIARLQIEYCGQTA